jgi:hypothetical protein
MHKRTCEHARHRYECVSCQFDRQRAAQYDREALLETALVVGWGVLMVLLAVALG